MTSQLNTQDVIDRINERIASHGVAEYYGLPGKRAIKWFKRYRIGGGAYSVSIGEVRTAVNFYGGYDSGRFDRILSESHESIFTECDKIAGGTQ